MVIYPLNLLQEGERVADCLHNANEGGNMFGKAWPSGSETGIEKAASDSFVRSDPICNLFNICSARFANCRQRVNIRNFERKKRIGRVFDQLGAIDIGDHDRRHKWFVLLFYDR